MAGAAGWEDIAAYGAAKLARFRALLPFAPGAPSDDTRRRFCRVVAPWVLRAVVVACVRALFPHAGARLIAIAGTPARRSPDGAARALQLGSAVAPEARLGLAQTAPAEQSHASTALPAL
jgi:DDE family transposase